MDLMKLKEEWYKEEAQTFRGWDFSYLEGRWENEQLPWEYKEVVLKYLKPTDELLDLGTGGGEFLLTLNHPYSLTSVTESYVPNVELCKERLGILGVDVKQSVAGEELPFEKESFDLMISRHESYEANEVERVLRSGGYLITQQVGGSNNNDLSKRLIKGYEPQFREETLINHIQTLEEAGLEVLYMKESFPRIRFFDIGALVYFAKIIEWEFPGFKVDTQFEQLVKLQQELDQKGYVEGTEHRFIIVARKK